MLAFGLERSMRAADTAHPYGYGFEQYVWAMVRPATSARATPPPPDMKACTHQRRPVPPLLHHSILLTHTRPYASPIPFAPGPARHRLGEPFLEKPQLFPEEKLASPLGRRVY